MPSGLIGQHQTNAFSTPIDGDALAAAVPLGNDNTLVGNLNAHDNDESIHIQQSVLASRPGSPDADTLWWTTDGKRLYRYTGSTWDEIAYVPSVGGTLAGNLLFSPDATYDIGAAGATRPATIHVGTNLLVRGGTTSAVAVGVANASYPSLVGLNAKLRINADDINFLTADGLTERFRSDSACIRPGDTDNTYDVGASAAKFRTGYFGTSVRSPLFVGGSGVTLEAEGANSITLKTNSSARFTINSSGHIIPANNGAYDLGSTTFRFKDGWFGGDVAITGDLSVGGSLTFGTVTSDNLTVGVRQQFLGTSDLLVHDAWALKNDDASVTMIEVDASANLSLGSTATDVIINGATTTGATSGHLRLNSVLTPPTGAAGDGALIIDRGNVRLYVRVPGVGWRYASLSA